jgi:molybdopterin converting factor small subunit
MSQITIHLELFSILKECLPAESHGRADVALPAGANLADLVREAGLDRRLGMPAEQFVARSAWQILVNGTYEPEMARPLANGDTVRIFPPIAGG